MTHLAVRDAEKLRIITGPPGGESYPQGLVAEGPARSVGDVYAGTDAYADWTDGWIYPTLLNGWANFGGGHVEMKYRKIPGGLVQMQGMIRNGTVGGGTPMFYLDAGYRPAYQHLRIVNASGATGRIEIYQDGKVSAIAGSVSYFAVVTSFHLD